MYSIIKIMISIEFSVQTSESFINITDAFAECIVGMNKDINHVDGEIL